MRVRQVDGAAEFLEATVGWRGSEPVLSNILGSIAQGVIGGRAYEREFWFVVEDHADGADVDGGDVVVGAALWTPPHKLVVGPMSDAAARAVGAAAAATGVAVTGVVGPAGPAEAAAEGAGVAVTPYMGERILVLGDYAAPPAIPGVARRMTDTDVELAIAWTEQFCVDAGVLVVDTRAAVASRMAATWFWEVEGEPVAMAGHAPVVATPSARVARVGPVYTPAALRGRGYGTAITAAVVDHLLPLTDIVMLYTDAANPTSNGVYERLGFTHTADVVDLDVVASS